MEHAQRVMDINDDIQSKGSLNPYFNGTCSKSKGVSGQPITDAEVLILILMEHAQRVIILLAFALGLGMS